MTVCEASSSDADAIMNIEKTGISHPWIREDILSLINDDNKIALKAISEDGTITGFRMRCEKSKYTTVRALQSIGFETIASGDSHNDLGMIQASKAGFLFKSTDAIKAEYPEIPAYETYDELLAAIKAVL